MTLLQSDLRTAEISSLSQESDELAVQVNAADVDNLLISERGEEILNTLHSIFEMFDAVVLSDTNVNVATEQV